MKQIHDLLAGLLVDLASVAGECALFEAEQILMHILKCPRSDLYLDNSLKMSDENKNELQSILTRRLLGEPLAYVLGSAYFYSMEIVIDRNVLIPRPETEILVAAIIKNEKQEKLSFLDMGTGSGAIMAVLCKERTMWRGIGIDISANALKTARINCPVNKAGLVCGDMFSFLKDTSQIKPVFDFIVSNPPYVSEKEMAGLDKSVALFEPHSALCGGKEGLDFYYLLAAQAPKILKPGGRIYCEIGCAQKEKALKIFSGASWKNAGIVADLALRPRVVMAVCRNG
jgi:release factor glutamine methyltransferase